HWTLPVWFVEKGHWLNKESSEYFARFVEKVVSEYKDLVKFWVTLNEPNIYTSYSFLRGIWPPFEKSFYKMQEVVKNLIAAHKESYRVLHKISSDCQVGIANNNNCFQGILSFFSKYFWNHQFFDAIKDFQEFVGVNYYIPVSLWRNIVKLGRELTDMSWQVYPKGLYRVLKDLKQYNKPIYITENGLADAKDEKRTKFIIDHLKWVHKAIEEGVDVRGYFHWSLIDNF
ncbi:MAG: glycoside hydrolase family 1 protein, partial [Candidatus Portnoybacteria bacterium CG10_big_fil_rev_8_21_14_0_10_38_18]